MSKFNRFKERDSRKRFKKLGTFASIFALVLGVIAPLFANSTNVFAACSQTRRNSLSLNPTAADAEVVSVNLANKVTSATPAYATTPAAVQIPASGWTELSPPNIARQFSNDDVATNGFFFPVSQFAPTDTITVRFKNAATYNGANVDIIATWSNIISKTGAGQLQIAKRFYAGELGIGIYAAPVEIKIVAPGSSTPLANFTSGYLTVLSINPTQITKPLSNISGVTLSSNTAIIQVDTVKSGLTGAYTGGDSNWTDYMGGATFHRGAVQYSLASADFSFYNGWDSDTNTAYWASYSTALLVSNNETIPCPTAPVKTSSAETAKTGDNLTFQISQRTQGLGTEILANYTSFVISDTIDSRLSIDPAKITVSVGGQDQTSDFAINFDTSSRTLTVTANSDILTSRTFYGQEVVVNIPATITSEISPNNPIKNHATSTIDGNPQDSNEITISAPGTKTSPTPTAKPSPTSAPKEKPGAPNTAILATTSVFAIILIGLATLLAIKKLTAKNPAKLQK